MTPDEQMQQVELWARALLLSAEQKLAELAAQIKTEPTNEAVLFEMFFEGAKANSVAMIEHIESLRLS